MEDNKRFITDVLANAIMDNYACLYLSVNNCVSENPDGIFCSEEDAQLAMEFARTKFNQLMGEVEQAFECTVKVINTQPQPTEEAPEAEPTPTE